MFDEAARKWDLNGRRLKVATDMAETLRERRELNDSVDAMEFGCGTGLACSMLAGELKSITAVDFSSGMVEKAGERIRNERITNVEVECIDLMHEDYDKRFDLIYTCMTMHHIKDIPLILSKLHGLLREKGKIAVIDLEKEDGSFHRDDEKIEHRGFEPSVFCSLMKDAGFRAPEYYRSGFIERYNEDGVKRGDYPFFLIMASA
jgi:ubiquinone/menaquinone biosynthesis C-methylase UbiE